MPKVIKYPKLLPIFGVFDPQEVIRNRRYMYFVRQSRSAVPLWENAAVSMLKMPEYFVVGSTTGKVLTSMKLQLENVSKLWYFE